MASRARHRRRRRSTLPVPALAGTAALAVAVAGSLTAPAAGASSSRLPGDVLALDAPARPEISTQPEHTFAAISDTTQELEVVTQTAATSAHETLQAAEVERLRGLYPAASPGLLR